MTRKWSENAFKPHFKGTVSQDTNKNDHETHLRRNVTRKWNEKTFIPHLKGQSHEKNRELSFKKLMYVLPNKK
jgi:hypothetical protein